MNKSVNSIYESLDKTCRKHDYAGWDPFDGLNSRLFKITPLAKSRFLRLAWLQFFKRSPINFRSISLVPRTRNAKALGLFTLSYIKQNDLESAKYCLNKMLDMRSDNSEWGNAAWGYPFDWQAKAFFVAKGAPNVICTTYAILALEAAKGAGISDEYDSLTIAAADFVIKHLWRDNEQGKYIAYIPTADALVHNASLWGAFICSKAYEITSDDKYKTVVKEAVKTTLNAQQENGSWVYGSMSHHQFIDGFHTGYNLEALHRINQTINDPEIKTAIDKGMKYYIANFFSDDGQASYYNNKPYPLDAHSYAQAIITLDLIKPKNYKDKMELIINNSITKLWSGNGHFYYQRNKYITNKINYLRWTQSWMHLALSTLK